MMSERNITLDEIKNLIERFQKYEIPTQDFCNLFEQIWNFEFDKNSISNELFESLDFLFDEVALFCPLPREKWEYPKYRDETEIRTTTEKVYSLLRKS